MSSSRQLAAILFADIQGYTALMQVDEVKAKNIRDKFQKKSASLIPSYGGRIIQFAGDGMMCLFNSAVDAVLASIEIQQQMQQEPVVPLRIGIHSGDVIIEDNDIIGDSVNLASRVESFASPGSVLISEKVLQEIKNKPGIQTVSMGKYSFKNVSAPVEIFAICTAGLIVPSKKTLQGKGKLVSEKKWLLPVTVVVIIALAALSYFTIFKEDNSKNNPGLNLLSSAIRESRIAVLPFENKTNDPKLEMFGTMAADYIIQSLLNLDNVKVVMFNSIEENLPYSTTVPGSGKGSFAERTGAEMIIKGSLYIQEDKLLVQSQVINAISGEVEIVLPEIASPKNELQTLVKELAARFAGYFAMKEGDLNMKLIPKYEAYLKFREIFPIWGIDVPGERKILSHAIAMDSTFLYPYLFSFVSYYNRRQWKEADSVMKLTDRRFDRLTTYEQAYVNVNKAMLAGNLPEAFRGWKSLYERDPKNVNTNIWAAGMAMVNWKYKEALGIFRNIDPASVNYDAVWKAWWAKAYAICLIRVGQFNEIRQVLNAIPSNYPFFANEPIIYAHVLRGEHDSLRVLMDKLTGQNAITPRQLDSLHVLIAEKYSLIHDTARQLQWSALAIQRIKTNQKSSPALMSKAYYMANKFDKSANIAQHALANNNTDWEMLSRLGCSFTRMGLLSKAHEIISRIESIKTPFVRGENSYALAEIYAALGEKEKAVEYMKKAFKEGRAIPFGLYEEDADFIPLHGYTSYEEFIRPRD
jgi:TolB-like protein/tetratricopeptide (TPR) repeat protein